MYFSLIVVALGNLTLLLSSAASILGVGFFTLASTDSLIFSCEGGVDVSASFSPDCCGTCEPTRDAEYEKKLREFFKGRAS